MTLPSGSRTVTVAPASPVPVTIVPMPLIVEVRPMGAVMSGAVACPMGETLPAASAWVSETIWPLAWAGLSGAVTVSYTHLTLPTIYSV